MTAAYCYITDQPTRSRTQWFPIKIGYQSIPGEAFFFLLPIYQRLWDRKPKRKIIKRTRYSKKPKKEGRVLSVRNRWEEDREESYRLLYLCGWDYSSMWIRRHFPMSFLVGEEDSLTWVWSPQLLILLICPWVAV
jgi:hypothetical protein